MNSPEPTPIILRVGFMSGRKRNRKRDYAYALPGYYFVTICTQDRMEWFGEIEDGVLHLNQWGHIAKNQLQWLAKQYWYVQLVEFVVMPNHVHAIIVINTDDAIPAVGAVRERPLRRGAGRVKTLGRLVGAFKTTSSSEIHNNGFADFAWQRSFHDHIIRNDQELERIRWYIKQNPVKWARDRNHFIEN